MSRTSAFMAAAGLLLIFRLGLFWARRRGTTLFAPTSPSEDRWSLFELLLASFLTLFAELAFIRWMAVEIRVFAYFKNLALLLGWVFSPIWLKVRRQMDMVTKALTAYYWNFAGSLAGVLALFAGCRLMLSSALWLGAVLAGFALLQRRAKERLLIAALIIPAA